MDPLSLIANLVAVANAAAIISQKLQKLAAIRHVPEQVLQLANEVSDFRCVLASIDQTLHRLNETNGDRQDVEFERYIGRLIERGLAQLDEIDKILGDDLIFNSGTIGASPRGTKAFWVKWLKKHAHLPRLSAALRGIRRDLFQALLNYCDSVAPSTRVHLDAIASMQNQTQNVASRALENFGTRMEFVTEKIRNIQPSLDGLQNMLREMQLGPQPSGTPSYSPSSTPRNNPPGPGPTFQIRTAIQKSCGTSCRCQCHKTFSLNSPLWMKNFLGHLFIGYTGTPIFGQRTCNEKLCQQQSHSILKINYYFPSWFLHRILVFREYPSSLLAGERMISIRTPRLIDRDCDAMMLARCGNVEAMQILFSRGLASPFDTSFMGQSLLQVAVSWKRIDMCKLLLAESADPSQESVNYGSPIDYVWTLILQNPSEPLHKELKSVFEPFLYPAIDLQHRRFSPVHQCVLGISKIDLEQYLQMTTADIDTQCSKGNTPLFWAASSSNLSATRTLLKFGARTDVVDPRGHNVLHRAVSGNDINVLKTILRTLKPRYPCVENVPNQFLQLLNQEDGFGCTPLGLAAFMNKPDYVKVLLDYGATLQNLDDLRVPPLLIAAQVGADAILEIFLRRGARTDVKVSTSLDSFMHLVAIYGSIRTFGIVQDCKVCCLNLTDKNLDGLTSLQAFDTERQIFTSEDEATFLESRKMFLELLSGIEQRLSEHGCLRDMDVVGPVDEVQDTASLPSDEDEFFDVESTFEESL